MPTLTKPGMGYSGIQASLMSVPPFVVYVWPYSTSTWNTKLLQIAVEEAT